mgnify:CR=1 FL=1
MGKIIELKKTSEKSKNVDLDELTMAKSGFTNKEGIPEKKVDISKTENVICPRCGKSLWSVGYFIKEVSGIEVGDITHDKIPISVHQFPVFVCANCGELAPFQKKDKAFMKAYQEMEKGNGNPSVIV